MASPLRGPSPGIDDQRGLAADDDADVGDEADVEVGDRPDVVGELDGGAFPDDGRWCRRRVPQAAAVPTAGASSNLRPIVNSRDDRFVTMLLSDFP